MMTPIQYIQYYIIAICTSPGIVPYFNLVVRFDSKYVIYIYSFVNFHIKGKITEAH